jgi:demethylmenaquinone methyltransferase / 2-methoxy-6-polyprenyl-1,4-benzoquinol methylase
MSEHGDVVKREFERQAPDFARPGNLFENPGIAGWIGSHLPLEPEDAVLDVCGGAGHLSRRLADRARRFVVLDLTPAMLETGRRGAREEGATNVEFVEGDASAMPFADGSFDVAFSRFAFHHLPDPEAVAREMARVVRPGGRVVILEITTPTRPPLSTFFRVWFDGIVPALGRLSGNPEAYEYLPSSVKRFPAPDGLAAVMDRAGLHDIRWILTAGGIIAIHVGEA